MLEPFEHLRFSSFGARVQYHILMALFRLGFLNRYLFGIFARGLARFFSRENAVYLKMHADADYKIYLDDGYWTRFALFRDDYEEEVKRAIDAAEGHAALFCDLGANKGYWTVYASAKFDRVIAIDASSATFEFLSENASHLANVTCKHAAIYDRSGDTIFVVNVSNSHASAHVSSNPVRGDKDRSEPVKTLAIDDLVPAGLAALIKLDIEGAEIAAINGAGRAIEDGSVLIFEDHGSDLCSETSRQFLDRGLDIYSIEIEPKQVRSVQEIAELKTDQYRGYNFLAARSESRLLAAILKGFETE